MTLCSTSYRSNTRIQLCHKLHVGGPHWLPVRQHIEYGVTSLVCRCQLGLAPSDLTDLCRLVSGTPSSRSLHFARRSCSQFCLPVPLSCRTTLVVWWAPMVWNYLLVLRLLHRTLSDTFYNHLKTVLFYRAGIRRTSGQFP